jgi:hypothetical protein
MSFAFPFGRLFGNFVITLIVSFSRCTKYKKPTINQPIDHIISLKGEIWTNKTGLAPPFFLMTAPSQENER